MASPVWEVVTTFCLTSVSHSCVSACCMLQADIWHASPPGPAAQSSPRRSSSASLVPGPDSGLENASCSREAAATVRSCSGTCGGSGPTGWDQPKNGTFLSAGATAGRFCGQLGTCCCSHAIASVASLTGKSVSTPGVCSGVAPRAPSSISRGATSSFGIATDAPHAHAGFISSLSQSTLRMATSGRHAPSWPQYDASCNADTSFTISGAKCLQCGHHGAKNSSSTCSALGSSRNNPWGGIAPGTTAEGGSNCRMLWGNSESSSL
mmetsp:Transcript_70877/g.200047  ORF Transcript_70877/g.200047 Transcript_70877/m.200047 type:complete len:265 (+) Transcript_70877:226-1020(+)